MSINDRIRKLSEQIIQSHKERSFLDKGSQKQVFNTQSFVEEQHEGYNFRQSAFRINIPKDALQPDEDAVLDTSFMARDLAEAIVNAEHKILKKSIDKNSRNLKIDNLRFKQLKSRLDELETVDLILMPLDAQFNLTEIGKWNKVFKRTDNGTKLKYRNKEIPIIRSHKNFEFNDIYAIDSSKVDVIQKMPKQMSWKENPPEHLRDVFENKNTSIQFKYGKSQKEEESYDYLARTIYSVNVEQSGVIKIDYPDQE